MVGRRPSYNLRLRDLDGDIVFLFADENKDARGQRHKIEQKDGGAEIQAEP